MAASGSETAAERAGHLAPVAKPADPLFLATSVEWIMDASIPIEIRMLCQMILAKALTEAKAEGRDFTDFGRDQVTTKINVEWIVANTGWPKGKSEAIRAEALEKGYLTASGSSRTGYQYTVTMSLRTHRAPEDVPAARSLFASDHSAPKPKPSPQLELGDVGEAAQGPPDMRRWSRADRDFYSRSSGPIRLVFSRLSGAERKLFSRLSGANQDLYARTPGADSEFLARLSGANDELYSRRSGVKHGLYKVRARSQEAGKKGYQNLLAEWIAPDILRQLLLLARKREEDTEDDSATFVHALERIVTTLVELCEADVDRVRETLLRTIQDERVTSHENPIALMLRGICNKPRFLLSTRYASKIGKTPDERAYYLLPEPVQHSLLDRIRRGALTPEWCKERDISDAAARAAKAIVANENALPIDAQPSAIVSPTAADPQSVREDSDGDIIDAPNGGPGRSNGPRRAVQRPILTLHQHESSRAPGSAPALVSAEPPAWWPALAAAVRGKLTEPAYQTWFTRLAPRDRIGTGPTIVAPSTLVLVHLRKALGRDLASELEDLGFYGEIVVEAGS